MKEFKSLELEQVDRLELCGVRRRSDGIIEYNDYEFKDWPEKLDISTTCNEDEPVVSLAWYVLDV